MPEEVRREILQILYDGRDDQTQALEAEDLARLLHIPLQEIRPDIDSLQEDGYIYTRNRRVNSRTYHFLTISSDGIKYHKRPHLKLLNIFISSPGDVLEECKTAMQVIEQCNNLSFIASRYVLRALRYEVVVPGEVGHPPQATVDRYMRQAGQADIFIGILCQRMGTPILDEKTGVLYQSGTEYEFMSAYRANQKYGKPKMLLYRGMKTLPVNLDQEQWDQVNAFFNRFLGVDAELKGLPKTYTTVAEFGTSLLHDLDTLLANNDFS
jgi:hypothetical protein